MIQPLRTRPLAALLRAAGLAIPLAAASCAGLETSDQGVLQPQSVTGPCQVKKFYLLTFTAVRADMTVANTGQACGFTILNPALQIVNTAALVTAAASHGQADAALVLAGRQVAVTYVPQPGYAGPDRFTVTVQPADRAVAVTVTVQPPG